MMKFSFLYSLRSRATGLVLLAILPLLVLILYSYYDQHNQAIRELQEDELVAVRNMAHSQEAVFNTLRQLLTTLARLPEVQSHDMEACNALFAELLKLSPHSVSIVATDAEGRLFASAPAVSGLVNYSDRSWFKKIMQTRDLVMGEIIVGRISGKCGNNLAYPILDKEGRFLGALSFHLNLDWVGELLSKSKFPPTTAIALSDSSRKVLFRYPHPEKFLGRMLPEALIKPMAVSNEGVAEGVGLPGDPRLFAFARLSPPWQEMWMLIGLPRDSAMAPAKTHPEAKSDLPGPDRGFFLDSSLVLRKIFNRPPGVGVDTRHSAIGGGGFDCAGRFWLPEG